MDEWIKFQVKRALKSYFYHQKNNKKAGNLCTKLSPNSNMVHELEPKKVGILLRLVNRI